MNAPAGGAVAVWSAGAGAGLAAAVALASVAVCAAVAAGVVAVVFGSAFLPLASFWSLARALMN